MADRELADLAGGFAQSTHCARNRQPCLVLGCSAIGLVRTVDNFGATGAAPTHPELLDYLAVEFVNDGYSIKRLIRRLMLTRSYRMSSAHGTR